MDASGLSTVQKPPKILPTTGKKQVGLLTSAERRQHVTTVCCMDTVGNFVPPRLIFSRRNRKDELLDKAPPDTLGIYQESGWMTNELFVRVCHLVKKNHPIGGFANTGINPFNPEVFPEHLFTPADTTDRDERLLEQDKNVIDLQGKVNHNDKTEKQLAEDRLQYQFKSSKKKNVDVGEVKRNVFTPTASTSRQTPSSKSYYESEEEEPDPYKDEDK
ncbi:hypothetical protein ILUMI_05887, partial [Ignelater luminosus]